MSEEERQSIQGEYDALMHEPGVLGAEQLQPAESATTVRVDDGRTLTTDGPFADTKEILGGLYLVEADNLDGRSSWRRGFPRRAWAARSKCGRWWSGNAARAGLPGGVGARPRQPDRLPRRLRPRRGGRAGGVRDRRRALAAQRRAGQPGRVAGDDGAQPGDRPAAARPHPRREDPAARGCPRRWRRRWRSRPSPTSGWS